MNRNVVGACGGAAGCFLAMLCVPASAFLIDNWLRVLGKQPKNDGWILYYIMPVLAICVPPLTTYLTLKAADIFQRRFQASRRKEHDS